MGPRHRRDRLDRLVVLLRLPRQQPHAADRPGARRTRASAASCGPCTAAASTTRRSTSSRRSRFPTHLHWFYWESYSTWLTGFALFTVLYLYQASSFLIDKSLLDWSPAAAIAAALAFLVVFWVVYDVICRAFGRREGGDLIVGIGVTVFVVFASWLACHLFAGPRRVPARGRDDGHGDERQRVLLDHPRPAQGDRAAQGRRAGGSGARPARQAAQRAQHLLHAAGADRDAQQPLRLPLRRAAATGWCWW